MHVLVKHSVVSAPTLSHYKTALFPTSSSTLVVLGSSLAGLELLKVPVADLHITLVVVHALRELRGGALAVAGVPLVVLGGSGLGLDGLGLGSGSRLGGAAGEEAADGVADGGTDRNTAVERKLAYVSRDLKPCARTHRGTVAPS